MTPADELRRAAATLRHPSSARVGRDARPVRLAFAAWLDATASSMERSPGLGWGRDEALAVARAINGDQT